MRAALRTAEKAIEADLSSPVGFWTKGAARLRSADHEPALPSTARAIQRGPSRADTHVQSGVINAHYGDPQVGFLDLERADPLSLFDAFLDTNFLSRAMAHLRLGNLPEAA